LLVDLDEDALARALFGGLDDRLFLPGGHVREPFGPTRFVEDLGAFLDVGEPVVEQGEHVGRDLLTEAVAGAQVLVDPDLHRGSLLVVRVDLMELGELGGPDVVEGHVSLASRQG